MGSIEQNYQHVLQRIEDAANRAHRDPNEVRLVCVTKTVGAEEVRALYNAGAREFGENRIPAGPDKVAALSDLDCTWHFIGHLQRNKASKVFSAFRILHSLESAKLVDVIQRIADKEDTDIEVFVEVNVAGEENKYGLAPDQTEGMLRTLQQHARIHVRGLMTMAPFTDDPETTRPVFAGLRSLRNAMREKTGLALPDLSMGMSNDFEVAIEEGATLVRVGSALFSR